MAIGHPCSRMALRSNLITTLLLIQQLPRKAPQHPGPAGVKTGQTTVQVLSLPRKIQASAWATKHGLAGRNLEEIRQHERAWQGWSNHNLRALTQGRYVSINFARSIKEAMFISFLLQHIREHKLVLDQIAECFCADSGKQVASSMAEKKAKNPSG